MRKYGLDLLLILTLILALGTIVQDFRFDSSLTRERASALSTDRELGSLEVALADLRAAQTGYLATGQEPETWMTRVSDLTTRIEGSVAKLKSATSASDLRGRYDAALAALAEWSALDRRAREDVKRDQKFMASDLIFVEGAEVQQRLGAAVAAARTDESQASAGRATRLANLRLGMNAVTLGFVLIVAWRANRIAARQPAPEATSTAQMIRDLPPPVKVQTPTSPGTAARVTAPVAAPVVAAVNLPGAADLCVDLARLMDARDVPALLERAATVLEAKGIIIWSVESDGTHLRPSLTHGYSDKVVARLGGLPTDADNVTSLAFRTSRPQAMNGGGTGAAGAIAVPLVTSAGCVGVFSAEVRSTKPGAEHVALARIIAAQFATLVGPLEGAASAERAIG